MRLAVVAFALAALRCAPGHSEAAVPRPRVVIETARGERATVTVEIARTEAERATGLMYRRELAPDAGMLFLFDAPGEHFFWMKNTLIPLDMIFIGDDGRVTGIVAHAIPGDLRPRSAGGPSRYVLEVNGGWAESHGVAPGDRVRFENVPRF